ncbi:putative neurofilament heavy polypeptide [Cocos nucifera]|uniref:Putative neurofilament heavy polypeptide n=1 Tax=Cocos nucifera TaxID=13894 RepID=A0A8K0HZA1_COCNU|nr:putative neurofilament heavy polypeptide [Cocos nucifera]
MGGCATKPANLKVEFEAPRPLEEPLAAAAGSKAKEACVEERKEEAEAATSGGQEIEKGPPEENRRRSLGLLFKEKEENSGPSETGKTFMTEAVTPPLKLVEAKEEAVQYKAEVQYTEESKPESISTDISNFNPTTERTSDSSAVQPETDVQSTEESKPRTVVADVSNPSTTLEQASVQSTEESKPKTLVADISNPNKFPEKASVTSCIAAFEAHEKPGLD